MCYQDLFKQLLILLLINSSPPAKSGEVVGSGRGSETTVQATVHLEKQIQERKEKSWEENN